VKPLSPIALQDLELDPGCSLALVIAFSPVSQNSPGRDVTELAALRSILAKIAACPEQALRLARTEHGKPYLEGSDAIRFNVSHAKSHSLIAISRSETIGCDIEDRITADDATKLSPLVLHPTELETLNRLPMQERQDAFRQYWVRKEAVLKASGSGFLDDPRRVVAGLDNARAAWSPGDGPRFHLHNRWIEAGCVAAVAGHDAACHWRAFAI